MLGAIGVSVLRRMKADGGHHEANLNNEAGEIQAKKVVVEYNTWGSRVIPDLSTNQACGCLTSQIGRDTVFSAKCGRTQALGMRSLRGHQLGGEPFDGEKG